MHNTSNLPVQVIELSGYTWHEKLHIARKYLEKQVRSSCAIPDGSVELTDDAMSTIIQQYCRESGVRNLKKQLEKVYRKAAKQLAMSDKIEVRGASACGHLSILHEHVLITSNTAHI
jgi:ATP-dependent Lon protease